MAKKIKKESRIKRLSKALKLGFLGKYHTTPTTEKMETMQVEFERRRREAELRKKLETGQKITAEEAVGLRIRRKGRR